jgi:hypothetical protein
MRPNVPRPLEYHFLDVTFESTRHLPSSPTNPNRTGVRHSWRYDYSNSNNKVSEQLYLRPIIPLLLEADIAFAIRAKPQGQRGRFSTKSGYLPLKKLPYFPNCLISLAGWAKHSCFVHYFVYYLDYCFIYCIAD